MADEIGRFEWVGKLAKLGLIGTIVLLALAIIATVVIGIACITAEHVPGVLWSALVVVVVGQIISVVWLFVLYGIVKVVLSGEDAAGDAAVRLQCIEMLMSDQVQASKQLVDLGSLSNRAKGLVFREREIEALRERVHHDIMRQDYKTAEAAIDGLERDLGYVAEAARLRPPLPEPATASS